MRTRPTADRPAPGAGTAAGIGDPVLWHDAECGGYAADLRTWERLAREGGGPVLDLGAGSGRVSLHLARRGLEVIAVDSDPRLLDALRARAGEEGLGVGTLAGDVRELGGAPLSVATAIAPMQLLHLLGGRTGRERLLRALFELIEPGGSLHAALLAEMPAAGSFEPEPIPDIRESSGRWVHSSAPISVDVSAAGLEIVRLRQLVAPDGALSEERNVVRLERLEAERLEEEAATLGWSVLGRTPLDRSEDYVDSVIVSLGRPR